MQQEDQPTAGYLILVIHHSHKLSPNFLTEICAAKWKTMLTGGVAIPQIRDITQLFNVSVSLLSSLFKSLSAWR